VVWDGEWWLGRAGTVGGWFVPPAVESHVSAAMFPAESANPVLSFLRAIPGRVTLIPGRHRPQTQPLLGRAATPYPTRSSMKKRCVLLALPAAVAALAVILRADGPVRDNSEVAAQCRDQEHLVELFTLGGRPVNKDQGHKVKVLVNTGYAVGYCEERRNPVWAAYLASGVAGMGAPERFERPPFFYPDLRAVPAVDGRTFGGGFDRGHMVPNAAIASQYGSLAQMETFFMTNMCPQKANLNQKAWADLEQWVTQAAEKKKHIHVLCGPIFGNNPPFTPNGTDREVQVPEAFYMILADTEDEHLAVPKVKLMAYKFGQDTPADADFKDRMLFGTTVKDIEQATKLDFFPRFSTVIDNWAQKEETKEEVHWGID
jgi:endonuclease G, mitochondrial